jgi:hypothetical protein
MSKIIKPAGRKQAKPPPTSAQLADLINGMARKDRLSLAGDLQRIGNALRRFAALVRQ